MDEIKKSKTLKINQGVHSHNNDTDYCIPDNEQLIQAIKDFSNLKLGFMMHFSPATQLGLVESWALSRGDAAWSRRDIDFSNNSDFNETYFNLNKTFNPIKFNAEKIADLAKSCGFKYLLFTTKHHDGFCMYDSRFTDYKITNEDCPFHKNKYADICKHLFDEFRKRELKISAYYSKADWHHNSYWDSSKPVTNRNVNYDITENEDEWNNFVEFTHNQFEELMSNYGPIDCLWLDAGWVRKDNKFQDIKLDVIIPKLREKYNENLIVVDRCCGGEFENILTPEQTIPKEKIFSPWESCITVGENFSFSFNENYKTARELIHLFIEILAKGGSLALNVTPMPDGTLPRHAVTLLRRFGRFVNNNSEAIYSSGISDVESYQDLRYVSKNNQDYAYILYRIDPHMPDRLFLPCKNKTIKLITLLRTDQVIPACDIDGNFIDYETCKVTEDSRIGTWIDTSKVDMLDAEAADCFRIEYCD